MRISDLVKQQQRQSMNFDPRMSVGRPGYSMMSKTIVAELEGVFSSMSAMSVVRVMWSSRPLSFFRRFPVDDLSR